MIHENLLASSQLTAAKPSVVQSATESSWRPNPSKFHRDTCAIHNQTSIYEIHTADGGCSGDVHPPNYFFFLHV